MSTKADGKQQIQNHGAWLLCDGGYHKWPSCLACPFQQQLARPAANWELVVYCTSVESTRKDDIDECVFRILKKRFLILIKPTIRQQIKEHNIERMFLTCCVLHNMTMEEECLHDWRMINDNDEEVYKDPLTKLVERNRLKKERWENSGSCWNAQFE